MKLFQYFFQLFGDGKAEMGGVLQDGESVVRDGPEDDRRAEDTRLVQHMDIQHLSDAGQEKGQYLPAEAAKADCGTELPVADGAHDAGQVVDDDKDQQRVQQPVAAAQEVAQPAADGGES